jgi:hypothetical protein
MMVNPIKNQPPNFAKPPVKKKAPKEVDLRVKKAAKLSVPGKAASSIDASQKIAAKQALMTAEKASQTARLRAFETQKAAVKAQKAALAAQRAHMAQQAAAARRARAAEKARKAALRAAKKAADLHEAAKVHAYLERPKEKKRSSLLKKYLPSAPKKKKERPKNRFGRYP